MCPANDSHDSSFVQIKKLGWRSRESPTMQTFYKDLFLSCVQFLLKFYRKFQTCEFTETALCDISFLRNFPIFSNQTFFRKPPKMPFLPFLSDWIKYSVIRFSRRCWEHGWGLFKIWWGGGGGGAEMLLKNTCEGVHLLVKLSALCLQACKFFKYEFLHTYFSRILARF